MTGWIFERIHTRLQLALQPLWKRDIWKCPKVCGMPYYAISIPQVTRHHFIIIVKRYFDSYARRVMSKMWRSSIRLCSLCQVQGTNTFHLQDMWNKDIRKNSSQPCPFKNLRVLSFKYTVAFILYDLHNCRSIIKVRNSIIHFVAQYTQRILKCLF